MELKDTIEGMISDDYKERFVAEYQQLTIRINKLDKLVRDYADGKLTFKPASRIDVLVRQKLYMLRYAKILEDRAKTEGIELE